MVDKSINLEDIQIRTLLKSGDIGYVTFLHGILYKDECNYGIEFESYVAAALVEFYRQYDFEKDCVWVCEHLGKIVGFLALMHRGEAAQLRFFVLLPEYRGLGLGNKLLQLFMEFLRAKKYKSAYLMTTSELPAASHLYKKFGFALTEETSSEAFGRAIIEQRYDLILV